MPEMNSFFKDEKKERIPIFSKEIGTWIYSFTYLYFLTYNMVKSFSHRSKNVHQFNNLIELLFIDFYLINIIIFLIY